MTEMNVNILEEVQTNNRDVSIPELQRTIMNIRALENLIQQCNDQQTLQTITNKMY